MRLRGLFRRKPLSPGQHRIYAEARALELKRIHDAKVEAKHARIRARGVHDAQIAEAGRGSRVAGTLVTVGRSIGKKLDKIDMEKFEAHVTGVSLSKPKDSAYEDFLKRRKKGEDIKV